MSTKKYSFATLQSNSLPILGCGLLLVVFLYGCSGASTPTNNSGPGISWTKAETPLFPENWPPTSETVWVQYTFAYGMDPVNLMDGSYVTQPLSKMEWKNGNSSTTKLNDEMTQAGIQGIVPLNDKTSLILEKGKQVSAYCLTLTELPDLNLTETEEMLAYYNAWFKYNGAFLKLITEDHTAFIDWVLQNQ
jgi:hypothetical protein